MNLNRLLKEILATATGLEVEQDEYEGKDDKYIIFVYSDERPDAYADNKPTADVAYMQIQLITPKSFNYLELKKIIRDTLEDNNFIVSSISSMLGNKMFGTEKIRQTIFECVYAESRKEN